MEKLSSFNFEQFTEFMERVTNVEEFCQSIFHSALNDCSPLILKIIYQMFQIHSNFALNDELMSFFGLPVFVTLSESRLNYEIHSCQDQRLSEALKNVSNELKTDKTLHFRSQFFFKFVEIVLKSKDIEIVDFAIKIFLILLHQPSSRRFIKPILEDTLAISILKQKWFDQLNIGRLEDSFYFPIDEMSGIYYENNDEYIDVQFKTIRNLQAKLLNNSELDAFTNIPLNSFCSIENIMNTLCNISCVNLKLILSNMGVAGYSNDVNTSVLIDHISSSLLLRSNISSECISAYPTEVKQIILYI